MPGRSTINAFDYADRIKRAIGYRRRTQKDVADAIGISQTSMSKIARGETEEPGAGIIRAIAEELNVSADYLMGLSDDIERR